MENPTPFNDARAKIPNRKYDAVLLDLDGTLIDSVPGIAHGIEYALGKMGLPMLPPEKVNKFLGPPLYDAFRENCGFSEEKAAEVVKLYREFYSETGLFENEVYPGVREMLETFRAAGVTVTLATAKPEVFARRILERAGLLDLFDFAGGALMGEPRKLKHQVVAYVLEECRLKESAAAGRVLMIGDRDHDVKGAAVYGLPTLGVLYGYGSRGELLDAGAIAVVETTADVVRFVLGEPCENS